MQIVQCSKSYDDLLFAVILSCCFYACHRSGKLIQKNSVKYFDWQKLIKHRSVVFEGNHAQYHLPYHKGDPFYCGTHILFTWQEVADPVSLLHKYVVLCDGHHGAHTALFLCEDGWNTTHSWFDSKFFAVLGQDYGGHSPHAGGVTFLAGLGLSEEIIQVIGRWSSAAWKIYIRDNPTVWAEQQLVALWAHFLISSLSSSAPC